MLEKLGVKAEKLVRATMPDPFVLVLLLTIVCFGAALWTAPAGPTELLGFWRIGFWELLPFSMQMVLIVITGEALAASPLLRAALGWLGKYPSTGNGAVFLLAFCAIGLGWLHWGFGLVFSALAARELGRSLHQRKITVHYPLLACAAYMSMLLWHAGITASAPLLINTPGHFLEKQIGLVPLSNTVFLPSNLFVCAFLWVSVPLVLVALAPKRNARGFDKFVTGLKPTLGRNEEKPRTLAEKLERSYLTSFVIALLGGLAVGGHGYRNGFDLNHNVVNFGLLMLGLLFHRSPLEYARSVQQAMPGVSGIVLQFPFYGGLMGLMQHSGLGERFAHLFIQFASADSLPLLAYLASVATKLFVPSGGGEWAIEGPVVLQAAQQLGAPLGLTTLGIAYGNMVGNMFQPFWALPLLSLMGIQARDMMGYCLVVFMFAFPILGIALWFS